jgi:hypothetical protein
MNENREDLAASIQRTAHELAELMSPDLIDALSEAAGDDELWWEAAGDVRGFLHERGVELPDRVVVRLQKVLPPASAGNDEDSGGMRLRSQGECPPGTLPVLTRRAVCTDQVVVCGPYAETGVLCLSTCIRYDSVEIRRCRDVHDLTHRIPFD